MTKSEEIRRRRDAVVARGASRLNGLVAESAQGARIRDVDGREYVDLATGIGVMNVGHSTPEVVAAVREQVGLLQHVCFHVATYEPYVALCEKLALHLPHGGPTKAFLANSGAEAVENAVKIARQATGRGSVICFSEAFHGRTLLCLSLTSKVGYKLGCGPFAPEVYRLPYPSRFHYGDGLDEEAFVARELAHLRHALVAHVPAAQVAAIVIEPVAGEGGFLPCPPAFLRGLREVCDEHGIVLVFDEVQSGFWRTGRWAAYEHADVLPDVSTWAKAMGGGLPVAAVVGRAEVMDAALPGTLGGTYGGNPVACAAAVAAISIMERPEFQRHAQAVGRRVAERFEALQRECPAVADARGLGAMRAIELVDADCKPSKEIVDRVLERCLERGVLLLRAGLYGNVIRLLPPLSIDMDELDRALDVVCEEVLAASTSPQPTKA